MKSILVMLRSNAEEWARLLRLALPTHRVLTAAEPAAGPIAYAVVGKPPTGALRALEGLEVLFSVNAGIEALLESGELPDAVPLIRMADDGLAAGMLDWVLAQVLAWHRNLFDYRTMQAERRWTPLREKVAAERPVTVLGAGHLGRPVAEMLVRIGFPVRTWSRTSKQIEGVRCFCGPDEFEAAVEGAEILVNLLPLTPQTENILSHELFQRLAPGAVLVNAGRGRHVVDAELLAALDAGLLRAAVLDVFREEPLPEAHPFWSHPGVFVSPHVAAPTHAASAVSVIAANIGGYEAGHGLRDVVDRSRGY